jgi:hypothetical protein
MSKEFDEKKIKQILQQLQTQRKKWCPHNRNAFCWSFYYIIDNLKVNLDVLQMMHCLLCHFQPIIFMNSRKKLKKGLVTYYKTSGMTCLQKHLDADHLVIYKRFQKEINNEGKENVERQFANKRFLIFSFSISEIFASKDPFKMMMWNKKCLWKILHN